MMDKALDQTSRALERRYAAEGGLISQVLLRQTVREGGREGGREGREGGRFARGDRERVRGEGI
jgi:hypothetical protein